jgi:hypothetical protein
MNKISENNNENESQGNTSNSDNINENGKREKRTRNRPSKAERFGEEREELVKELEKRIGLTEEIRGVLLYDLEHNEELKEYLREKIPEIKRLYKTGNWAYFVRQHIKEGEEPSEISLLKSIMKSENYEITNRRKITERNEIKKTFIELYFNKKEKCKKKD